MQHGNPCSDDIQFFAPLDTAVTELSNRGLKIYMTLAYTPPCASLGNADGNPITDVPNPALYANYVRQSVAHYRAMSVTHFGLWNEANLSNFWEGTAQQYVDNVIVPGAPAVTAGCQDAGFSDCKVLGPDMAHVGDYDVFLDDVLNAMSAASVSFDMFTHHIHLPGSRQFGVRGRLVRQRAGHAPVRVHPPVSARRAGRHRERAQRQPGVRCLDHRDRLPRPARDGSGRDDQADRSLHCRIASPPTRASRIRRTPIPTPDRPTRPPMPARAAPAPAPAPTPVPVAAIPAIPLAPATAADAPPAGRRRRRCGCSRWPRSRLARGAGNGRLLGNARSAHPLAGDRPGIRRQQEDVFFARPGRQHHPL